MPRSIQSGGGKPARPHHVAALRRADQIQKHVDHYAENPRAHATALKQLGVPLAEIRQIHQSYSRSNSTRQTSPKPDSLQRSLQRDFAVRPKTIARISPDAGLVGRFTKDLIDAAVYTPAGIYQAGKAVGGDALSTAKGKPTLKRSIGLGKAVGKGVGHDFAHPLRHPGRVFLDVAGAAAPVAGGFSRAASTASALREGASLGKALTRKGHEGGSLLHAPAPGRITHTIGDLKVETPASRNVIRRQAQKRLAAHRNKQAVPSPGHVRKVGAALERQAKIEGQAAQAPSHLLAAKGAKLNAGQQMALRVVAEGKPVADRIKFHREQGAKATSAVERHDHAKQIRLLRRADKYVEEINGKPVIRADAPKVGAAYGHLKTADAQREAILRDTGQMSEAALESRKHAPGRVIETGKKLGEEKTLESLNPTGGVFVKYDPAARASAPLGRNLTTLNKTMKVSPDTLVTIYRGAPAYQREIAPGDFVTTNPKLAKDYGGGHVIKKQVPASHVLDDSSEPLGEEYIYRPKADFRGGEAYVPGYKSEPKLPGTSMAQTGTVIGRVRNIVSKNKPYTGEALLHGKVPDNTTGLVARQTLRAVRYLQSDSFRAKVLQAAHDERRSEHDILVNDRTLKNPKLSPELKAISGKERYTLDELSGHATAFEQFRRQLFPMAHKNDLTHLTPEERLAAQSGGKVKGYKWVDERLLRGANRPAKYASTKTAKAAVGLVDTINNASKLAILYLKPAYAAPNIGGNVFLNIVQQGFAAPRNIAKAVRLTHTIGDDAKAVALSVMGEGLARALESQHGLAQGAVNFAAGKWSKIIDEPFRLAALIHAADKLGYGTPEKLRALLLDEKHHADMLEAVQRANDAIIDYTHLPELGKDTIRRVIFFYPWVVGSTRYAGHFIAEHPTKAAVTANLAVQGKEKAGLGPVPSYEQGAFKVGGKLVNPSAAGIFGTSAQVVDTLRGVLGGHPTEASKLSGFATPAVSLALANITRQNSLGHPFPANYGIKDIAKSTLFDSLPQVSLARRAQALGTDQGTKMFPVKNKWDVAGPFLIGGVGGRSYNQTTLNAQAKAENRANLTPQQRVVGDYKTFRNDLKAAVAKLGHGDIPKPLAARLNLRAERAFNRVKAAGGHRIDSKTAFTADIDLIVRHGWMTAAEAAKAKKWVATAPKNDLTSALRYLTSNYFDRDGELSKTIKYLRDNGHPDLSYPPLP